MNKTADKRAGGVPKPSAVADCILRVPLASGTQGGRTRPGAIQSVRIQHFVPVIGGAGLQAVPGFGGIAGCADKYDTVLDRTVVTGGVEEWRTDSPQHQLTSPRGKRVRGTGRTPLE